MTTHPFADSDEDCGEDLAEGGTWLLDLVAAVDHLRRGHRPGFTVWDALTEALEWGLDERNDSETVGGPETVLARLAEQVASRPAAVQAAVRRWAVAMAARYNNGHHWPHPTARRGFPPPLLTSDPAADPASPDQPSSLASSTST
ncbi:MAG: hypothetical protein AB7H92_14750 [Microbacteriaceae bacterium]